MKVEIVVGGRGNAHFQQDLAKYDPSEYRLVNVCINPGGKYVAFLEQIQPTAKPKPKSKPKEKEIIDG